MPAATIPLNPLRAIEIGLGTWQWGDQLLWRFGQGYGEADLREAFDVSRAAGVTLFDTAEVYGLGRSERYLGQFIRATHAQVRIATKFAPLP